MPPPPATLQRKSPFHIMTKPIGPLCNLDCKYCFYLEKEKMFPSNERFRMSDEVLEKYIRSYIEDQDNPEISFAWQGGEPTLLGVDYFRKIVDLQQKYSNGKSIENALQTNGTLLDDKWCEFLVQNRFLVGLSIDGPAHLHDAYRVDKQNRPTFDKVARGLEFLQKHKVEFNTLTVVNRRNSQDPLAVYRFLKSIGSTFLQFIPLVERLPDGTDAGFGSDLAPPPVGVYASSKDAATDWSVLPEDYGKFLCTIFDEWVRADVGKTYVQIFDVALGIWAGMGAALCVFSEKCGSAMAMEHNGDIYSCDHYVYPRYKLGNVLNHSIRDLVDSPQQRKFGSDKFDTLPPYCQRCEVRFACNGECPKHRFLTTPDGHPGLNYLCAGYKNFFSHIDPYMRTMTDLLRARRPPAEIMQMIAAKASAVKQDGSSRNAPCPCGSGKKRKHCHP